VPRVRMPALTALACLAALGLSACSDSGTGDAAVTEGNADACPTEVVDVVVSVSQWSDVVRVLGGDCVALTTVVSSGAVDPHDFEANAADLAAFSGADLVVVNGGHYDEWAADAVATLDPQPAVVSAAEVAGVGEGSDPHLWADPAIVPEVATAVTEALIETSGEQAYFDEQQDAWADEARQYLDAVAELGHVATGRTYAATEGVYDRMADAAGLTDLTPGDLAAFEAALADGSADVLLYNSQTSGSVPERLRAVAEEAGVPVVEVTESPEDAGGSFVEWQYGQVQQLRDALSGTS
jgi:zinc/manganese transport system substrate-binding protein